MCSEEIGRHPNHSQPPKLNKVTEIPQIAIPLVDQVLDTLGGGSVFSVFDLFSGFTHLTIHPDTIPLTAFCTPNGLYEWPRMPSGAAGTPVWFVSVMRLVTAGLDNIFMYLDDAIGPDDCPLHYVATLATFFARLHLHKLKLSPDKSRISATRVDFLGHVILADGVRPNDARVAALARMPMPTRIKKLRSLLGGLSYYRKFLPNMAYHIRPVAALLEISRNSPHPLYVSFRTGTRPSTCLDPCASALTDPDNLGVYLIRACGLTTPSCPAPGVSLGGLVPSPDIPVLGGLAPSPYITVLGGLPLTSDDFRTHRAPLPSPSATTCPRCPRANFPQAAYTTYAINARDDAPRPTRRTRSQAAILYCNTPSRSDYRTAAHSGFAASAAAASPPLRTSPPPRSARLGSTTSPGRRAPISLTSTNVKIPSATPLADTFSSDAPT